MNATDRRAVLSLLLVLSAAPAIADDPPTTPVTIAGAFQFDVTSKAGLAYRIFVSVPDGPAPEAGFPVIYVLDGNSSFGLLYEAERIQRRGNGPVAIVGVGYPTEARIDLERRYVDFTPPTPDHLVRKFPGSTTIPRTGGRDAFLTFLEDELKPIVERKVKLDRSRQAICGHSLGGLFVLHVLFTRPSAFQSYVAASPSIWWNDRSIEAEAQTFLQSPPPTTAGPARLLMTFGGKEGEPTPGDSPEMNEARKATRMPILVRKLADDLAPLADRGLTVEVVEFPDENHGSVIPTALSRGLLRSFAPPR